MAQAGGTKVKKEDRLFSLILALVATRDGLSKSDIYRSVRGYVDIFDYDSSAALDKMFERDKDEIRSMGIIIDTRELPEEEGQTHNIRYSISRANYDFPEGVTFTPAEMSLLKLAATAWREASLSSDSRHALTKLKSLGVDATDPIVGIAPTITTQEHSFSALEEALENELIMSFLYLKPGQSTAELRTASPLALLQFQGLWYMLAYDMDAQAERTFLLHRIVSEPKRLPQQTHKRDPEHYARKLEEELSQLAVQNTAELEIQEGSDAQQRLASHYGYSSTETNVTFGYWDEDLLAEQLVAFGAQLYVKAPKSLQDRVISKLESLRDMGEQGA